MNREQKLQQVQKGFSSIPLDEKQKQKALHFLETWMTEESYQDYLPQIDFWIEKENWFLLLDCFYRIIPFGTGGRRGAVGVGPNRINPPSIGSSVQGHVAYLKKKFPNESLQVVIAFDVRKFEDIRGIYSKERPNPLLHLSSKDFAKQAASVYAAHGVTCFLLNPAEDSYISTPELSFLIRDYKAHGGLNVSASHNHPDDNGGKFYNEQGGQPVPPDDQEMSNLVEQVENVFSMDWQEAVKKKLVQWIPSEKRQRYVDLNVRLALQPSCNQAKILYTPMHGTGTTSVGEVLQQAGFDVHLYQKHATFDGRFPNVLFHNPNPEVELTLQEVMEEAKTGHYDLVLATDPDADRIGACVPSNQGEWYFLNGNEIASLLTYYKLSILQKNDSLSENAFVVKTEVTTNLVQKIAHSFGASCVSNLLVGFKYIGKVLHEVENHGAFQSMKASLDDFVLGAEESHGILVTHQIRDKDAAGAALYLAEWTASLKKEGKTLHDALVGLYTQYGYFANQLFSMIMEGATGLAKIKEMMHSLRENPPQEIAGFSVIDFHDHWNESGPLGDFLSETDQSSRNVLVFQLIDGIRLILRPSGTEPKAKLYVEVPSSPCHRQNLPSLIKEQKELAEKLSIAFTEEALSRLDIQLPEFVLITSDLISIDKKQWLAKNIFPAWLQKTHNKEEHATIAHWLKESLSTLGKDPYLLLEKGLQAFVSLHQNNKEIHQKLQESLELFSRL